MDKYCSNCGQELRDNQEVCLGCGKILSKNMKIYNQDNSHKTYKVATGITMIILGGVPIWKSPLYESRPRNTPGRRRLFPCVCPKSC